MFIQDKSLNPTSDKVPQIKPESRLHISSLKTKIQLKPPFIYQHQVDHHCWILNGPKSPPGNSQSPVLGSSHYRGVRNHQEPEL